MYLYGTSGYAKVIIDILGANRLKRCLMIMRKFIIFLTIPYYIRRKSADY